MNARLIPLALSIQFTLSIPPVFSQTRVVVSSHDPKHTQTAWYPQPLGAPRANDALDFSPQHSAKFTTT